MAANASPRSRRAIITAGLGGLAAAALAALGRPPSATAADGDPVLAGQANSATTETSITAAAAATGLRGASTSGTGLHGQSGSGKGTYGRSTSSTGARGQSDTGIGVWGTSLTNRAVFGTTGSATLPAIGGQSTGGRVGVHGFTGPGSPPPPIVETGVEGVCSVSGESNGVHGRSQMGAGVWGRTVSGLGVAGTADGSGGQGVGVYAFGPIGLIAEGEYAAWFAGPTLFSEAGHATIASGSSTTFGVPGGVRAESMVLAVLQTNRPGVWVRAAVPNAATDSVTVHLNTAVTSATTIAWFVIDFPTMAATLARGGR